MQLTREVQGQVLITSNLPQQIAALMLINPKSYHSVSDKEAELQNSGPGLERE